MTLDALRAFCAVVETGSFRRAAERVHRSQPAVSQQIKTLERAYGHALIQRGSNRPTPAGSLVYDRAREILAGAENLDLALRDFDESRDVPLRIGASDTTALYFLPPVLKTFAKRVPGTRLEMMTASSGAVAQAVDEGALDLGVVTLPTDRDDLSSSPLFDQRLVLVVPKTHPLAKRHRVSLSKLTDEAFLMLDSETRSGAALRDHFRALEFSPRIVLESGSFEVIKRYAAEGLGLSILPEMAVTKADRNRLTAVRIPGLPSIPIGVVWRTRAYQTRAAIAFIDILGQSAKARPPRGHS